jgi:hypothetical protein
MRHFVLAALMTFAPISTALAQHAGTPEEQRACSRDASRLCRNELGNDTAVQQCLEQNRAHLSRSCSKVFASHGR